MTVSEIHLKFVLSIAASSVASSNELVDVSAFVSAGRQHLEIFIRRRLWLLISLTEVLSSLRVIVWKVGQRRRSPRNLLLR